MGLKLTNNAVSHLAWNIISTDVTINIIHGDGLKFPGNRNNVWKP